MLLRLGATPVMTSSHIAESLGIDIGSSLQSTENCSDEEKVVLELLKEPQQRDVLIRTLNMPIYKANTLISTMELKGLIKKTEGDIRRV